MGLLECTVHELICIIRLSSSCDVHMLILLVSYRHSFKMKIPINLINKWDSKSSRIFNTDISVCSFRVFLCVQ